MWLAELTTERGERLPCGFAQPSGQGAQEPAELAAAVHVRGGRDEADAPAAGAKVFREPEEDVNTPRCDTTKEIQVFRRQGDQRDSTVGRGGENGVGSRFEKPERRGQNLARRRDVAAHDDRGAAEIRGLPRRVLQPSAERAAALLEKRDAGPGQTAMPAGAIRAGSRDGESRSGAPGRVDPAVSERGEELLSRSTGEPLFERLTPGLPGEEKEETRRHSPHLTMRESGRMVFRKCCGR